MTVGTGEQAVVMVSLKNSINQQFTHGDRPEYMLKQLWELKQGQRNMEDFLVKFENLKLLSKILNDHTMEILQSNISWDAMKQFLYVYGPSTDYAGLKTNLQYIGEADAYLKTIHCPSFTPFNHPHVATPSTPTQQLL